MSIFIAKTKIALTGERSRVRKSSQNSISNTFDSIPFTEIYLFLVKMLSDNVEHKLANMVHSKLQVNLP